MKDIWLISDTHFCHENILKFRKSGDEGELIRGSIFSSIEEHDDYIIDSWNSVVKQGDKVYHLGDVFFGNKDTFIKKWSLLHGKKRLIIGNHDDAKFMAQHAIFQKIMLWRMFPEHGLILTHVPVHESTLYEGRFSGVETINVHGHIHDNLSPSNKHRCVCVEHIGYKPIHIEEVRNLINYKGADFEIKNRK